MGCCCGTLAKIKTEIEIDAPIDDVWRIFMNFDDHASWNSFCEIGGDIKVGNRIQMRIIKKDIKFSPHILCLDRSNPQRKEFRWVGNIVANTRGILDGEHYFVFETIPEKPNKTRFIHGENFSGCLTLTVLCCIERVLLRETRQGFIELNEGLKAKAEAARL